MMLWLEQIGSLTEWKSYWPVDVGIQPACRGIVPELVAHHGKAASKIKSVSGPLPSEKNKIQTK